MTTVKGTAWGIDSHTANFFLPLPEFIAEPELRSKYPKLFGKHS